MRLAWINGMQRVIAGSAGLLWAWAGCSCGYLSAAESPDLPEQIPLWDRSVTLRAGVGYKDNLLLSNTTRERSPFETLGADLLVFRLPIDGPQVNFFVNFEDTRYWEGRALTKEQFLGSQLQIKHQFNADWLGRLGMNYVYQDQVIDASDTLPALTTLRVIGQTFSGGPALRRNLTDHHWLEAELALTRQYYGQPLDDYWMGDAKMTWGFSYGHKSELTASYDISQRISDSASETDTTGTPLPGTTLEYLRQRWELSLRHNFDSQRRWRSVTRVGVTHNQDHGSGYFDYLKLSFIQQVRFVTKSGEIKAQFKYGHYDYPVQTIAPASPVLRSKDDLGLSLRGEKNLGKSAKLYAEYEHERAFSNRAIDEYAANTVTAGIEWEF